MSDLFGNERSPERLKVPDADLRLYRDFPLSQPPAALLRTLISETPWRQEEITVWGKRHLQPRLIAWYGDRGQTYAYSGIKLDPLPWTELLLTMKREIELELGSRFNSVLLNYYRSGLDSMGFHSDDEPELGPEPTIASLSLGEPRTFVLKAKRQPHKDVRLRLPSGSLLVMSGPTQKNWKHGIPKEPGVGGPRINLTFRNILS